MKMTSQKLALKQQEIEQRIHRLGNLNHQLAYFRKMMTDRNSGCNTDARLTFNNRRFVTDVNGPGGVKLTLADAVMQYQFGHFGIRPYDILKCFADNGDPLSVKIMEHFNHDREYVDGAIEQEVVKGLLLRTMDEPAYNGYFSGERPIGFVSERCSQYYSGKFRFEENGQVVLSSK